jgi:hypothetical integral membrane protein (TIGR02206 family)
LIEDMGVTIWTRIAARGEAFSGHVPGKIRRCLDRVRADNNPPRMPPFVRWGPSHLAACLVTIALPLLLAAWARADRTQRRARVIAVIFALVLLAKEIGQGVWVIRDLGESWTGMLPLHLCDFALFACVIAALARNQLAYELAYFWGLAGTMQGLLTPELQYGFPTLYYWYFFIGHGGIVATVLFLTFAKLGLRPRWRSVLHAYVGVLAYALVVGAINAALKTDYGFLCAKPAGGSLLDVLGPWPWYIGSLTLVALLFFVVLYLPWAIADAARNRPEFRS